MADEISKVADEAEPTAEAETPVDPAPPEPTTDEKLLNELDEFVTSSLPDDQTQERMKSMRAQAREMMTCVIKCAPDTADRRSALRCIQLSMLFALSSMLMPKRQFEKLSKEE